MTYSKIVIIGGGSVGQGIYTYLVDKLPQIEIAVHDPPKNITTTLNDADIVHITVPYLDDDQYYSMWQEYSSLFKKGAMVFIHSTLNPLLIDKLTGKDIEVYYVPIRTPEDTMEYMVCRHPWFIAPHPSSICVKYLYDVKIAGIPFKSVKALSFGKLVETTWSTMQIAYAQMVHRICEKEHIDFTETYYKYMQHSVIKENQTSIKEIMIPRPIFFPGKIEGKCLMQNLKILDENNLADLSFIEFILDSNDKVKS